MSHLLKLVLATILTLAVAPVSAATQTKADLLLGNEVAAPGSQILAGVRLTMPDGWHTYWRNPGDSGMATEIDWQLPKGVTAGEIRWPIPEKYESEGFYTYVYHDEVVLLVPLTVSADAPMGPTEIRAKVKWLECKEVCLPGGGDVNASLTIAAAGRSSSNAAVLETWQKKLPQPADDLGVSAHWESTGVDERPLIIQSQFPEGAVLTDFLPYLKSGYEIGAPTEVVSKNASEVRLRKKVLVFEEDAWPTAINGILVGKAGDNAVAYEITRKIESGATVASTVAGGPVGDTITGVVVPKIGSLWQNLFYAFLGGLILNIMPCVLPVISLKILGFVQQSKESPGRVRTLGLIYGLGVLVSFLVLAAVVIGLQQAGKAAGWGMQFQNPQFLVVITVLVTLVAMNLFGVFEFNLGGGAMNAASKLSGGEGSGGAFFNGVLATILATPCTAPFLAPALGFAFAQPPILIVVFFLTIGAGLAFPYVVLSFQPAWLKFLPKPGAWMEKFKIAMGFPMLATAFWLFSLASNRFGKSGTLWLGLFLVLLALGAWIYGEFVQRGRKARMIAGIIAAMVVLMGYVFTLEGQLHWRVKPVASASNATIESGGIAWQPWSSEAVAKAQAAGRPVFVDFTADWCVTCQVNKKTSIEIESVRKKLKEINAVTLLGDFTVEDPLIYAELQKFGRAGVPLVLVYSADATQEPKLLPEALTPGTVLSALDWAAGKKLTAR